MFGECLGRTFRVPEEVTVDSLHEAAAYYSEPAVTHEPVTFGNEPSKRGPKRSSITRNNVSSNLAPCRSITQSWRLAFDDQASSGIVIHLPERPPPHLKLSSLIQQISDLSSTARP